MQAREMRQGKQETRNKENRKKEIQRDCLTHVQQSSEGENMENGEEAIFEEIMVVNFTELMKT